MGAKAGNLNPLTAMIEGEYGMNKQAANMEEADAVYNAEATKTNAVKLRKEQQAQYAASGVELEGTPALVIKEDEVQAHIDAMNIIYAGKSKAALMRSEAKINRAKGYMELGKSVGSMAGGGK